MAVSTVLLDVALGAAAERLGGRTPVLPHFGLEMLLPLAPKAHWLELVTWPCPAAGVLRSMRETVNIWGFHRACLKGQSKVF